MSGPETKPLLIEIGCEEIPARFLTNAQRHFGEKLKVSLSENRLLASHSEVQTYSTPRRLVAHLPAILTRQEDLEEIVQGPSLKAAYDLDGRPTRAAESFAAKNGQTAADLTRVQTPKGEYMALIRRTVGRAAEDLLGEILSGVIRSLEFPKSMVWPNKNGMRFVRPIRWILVLFGADQESVAASFPIVSALAKEFRGAGIAVGYETRGHRSLGLSKAIAIESYDDYSKKLRENFVEFDPQRRRESIRLSVRTSLEVTLLLEALHSAMTVQRPGVMAVTEEQVEDLRQKINALPEDLRFRVVEDRDLEDWLVNSTEWPRAILGGFDPRFLALPREILITVMRGHQHYFAVEDGQGNLARWFVTVLNTDGNSKGLIRHGHERVLTARFRDAEFFWQGDQKIPLPDRLPMLERVTYQKDLGSYGDKVLRMKMIATEICQILEERQRITAEETAYALRAVELCKCDLTTQMVQEFTELQGEVGGLYAAAQGEPKAVADAIYDHYRPIGLEDDLPRSLVGAVVSLADKIDSVGGGFRAGLEPTGSSDPFGLRRAGNGIIRLAVEVLAGLDLTILTNRSLNPQRAAEGQHSVVSPEARNRWLTQQLTGSASPGEKAIASSEGGQLGDKVDDFLRERMEFYFREAAGLRYDTVRAVRKRTKNLLALVPSNALARARALERVRDTEDFLALASAAKRTRNIRKSASALDILSGRPDPALFTEAPEHELYAAYQGMSRQIERLSDNGDFEEAFRVMATIRPQVDRFFEGVLVMTEDPVVRRNRLMLLLRLNEDVFTSLADLAEITVESQPKAVAE